ncbi:sigma-70 family RNA polymerase sigma factor [Nonomuraea sp. NPDC048916]|uniref:RNA polymerase sigma factor n=1 Tax=Nonomuraea sp. NPDC048916 TaxID=3154232 RepID=UPI0033FBEA94
MNDRVLVEALRADDPGALAALYDSHAEGIYRYCWSLLRNSDGAQVALRDTLIAAEAHADSLADPDRLRPWLYALARGECLRRRRAAGPGEALSESSEAPPGDPADADLRVMAWNATQSLAPAHREVLELSARHEMPTVELAAILGMPPRQVETAREEARERLRDAITAEFLARKGPYDCPGRAGILAGFAGELTRELRDQLVRHVPTCATCSPHRTRQVSEAKVFELLPVVTLPATLRVRVMSCFVDPDLVPYRRYVARRSGALDAAGFPVADGRAVRRWPQAMAGAVAAVATVVAIAMLFNFFGKEERGLSGVGTAAFPAVGDAPGIRLPWLPEPQDSPVNVQPILDTFPVGATGSASPTGPAGPATPGTHPTTGPPGASPRSTPSTQRPAGTPKPLPTVRPADPAGPKEPPREPPRDHQSHTPTPCPTTPKPAPTRSHPDRPRHTHTPTVTPPTNTPTITPTPTVTPTATPEPTGTPT